MKRISIILPAYNTEKYLSTALESALHQSYTNTELIVVNDGSVDRTPAIVNNFKKRDSRVNLINQENKGLSAARNTGMINATGEIIAFLDSDDWWHPDYLQKMAELLSMDKRNGIAFSRIQFASEDGELLPKYTRGHVKNIKSTDFFYMNPLSCGSNIVIKREFLDNLDVFDESLKSVEDLDFLFRASLHKNYRIRGIKEYLVYYRIRDGLSHDTERMVRSWEQFMQKVKTILPIEYKRHYLPALLSHHINMARRALQSNLPKNVARNHLINCIKHPMAFLLLGFRFPVMALYTFPNVFLGSLKRQYIN